MLLMVSLFLLYCQYLSSYLRRIPAEPSLEDAPIVQRLAGILSSDLPGEDYRQHLEEKYAGQTRRDDRP